MTFHIVTLTTLDGQGLGITRVVLGCEAPARTLFDWAYTKGAMRLNGVAHLVRSVSLRQAHEPPYREDAERNRAEAVLDACFPDKGTFDKVAP